MTDDSLVSNKTKERGYLAPLYTSERDRTDGVFADKELRFAALSPNLNGGQVAQLRGLYEDAATPDKVLAYIYAVLYSPLYRSRYVEFLRSDFPRIPFTKDRGTFIKLAELGQQLIDLHLMRSPELDNPISRFCGKGDSAVTKVEYDAGLGRVSINPTQYFDGVTPDLWSYQIGGYQALAKWLKDRKGRFLTSADTIHYSRIVTVLAETIVIQKQIDGHSFLGTTR